MRLCAVGVKAEAMGGETLVREGGDQHRAQVTFGGVTEVLDAPQRFGKVGLRHEDQLQVIGEVGVRIIGEAVGDIDDSAIGLERDGADLALGRVVGEGLPGDAVAELTAVSRPSTGAMSLPRREMQKISPICSGLTVTIWAKDGVAKRQSAAATAKRCMRGSPGVPPVLAEVTELPMNTGSWELTGAVVEARRDYQGLLAMTDFSGLDDPAWHALTTDHAALGQRNGAAARYRTELSPIGGLARYDAEAFAELRPLVAPEEAVGLVSATQYDVPADWEVLQAVPVFQMVCETLSAPLEVVPVQLTVADAEAALELATATEPGPFRAGTLGMGRYFGLRSADGHLMAMTGERMRLGQLTEVSAVCTWPEFRGRGLAKALVSYVSALIASEGRVPFLHVKTENAAAIALYEKLGFNVRKELTFTVVRPR